jgi:hypothetical protein|tara:strand:+ start:1231 stop:2145 length:915 start_codon:yes stop_codon:yes gene_type:complete
MELGQNIDLINQHKLYLSNKVLKIYSDSISINDTISSIIDYSKKEHSFIILNEVEIINESEYFEAICNLLKSLPNEIYIMQSTLTNHIYSAVPLLNFIQWKHRYMRNVPTDTIDTVKMFPNYMFEESYSTKKTNKLILSVRADNEQRIYLRDNLVNEYDGIVRLSANNDTTWNELIEEYNQSIFSFIVETNYPTTTDFTSVTEKIMLSFLNNSIPIVLGKKNIISDLENCGFWIANKDFGFDIEDSYSDYSKSKVNAFIRCMDIVNKMSYDTCIEYYETNKEKIKNNRNIIVELYQEKYLKKLV